MVGDPYVAVVRLIAFADANWVTLDAEHPSVDLMRIPWRKLLSILYVANVQAWYHQEVDSRGEAGPAPTYDEFDFMLNSSLPGGSQQQIDQDFSSDYM